MRFKLLAAAAGLCISAPIFAEEIVQGRSEESVPFDFFDPSLGTLNSAYVEFSYRDVPLMITASGAAPGTIAVDYSMTLPIRTIGFLIRDYASIGSFQETTDHSVSGSVNILLSGPGPYSDTVDILEDFSVGFFLNPEWFVSQGATMEFNFFDIQAGGDLIASLTTDTPNVSLSASRGTFRSGAGGVRLVYTYTPAVPEPATWAMMLAGFGAVGAVMRTKRRPLAEA